MNPLNPDFGKRLAKVVIDWPSVNLIYFIILHLNGRSMLYLNSFLLRTPLIQLLSLIIITNQILLIFIILSYFTYKPQFKVAEQVLSLKYFIKSCLTI